MLVLPLGQQSHVLQATQDFNPAESMYMLFGRETTTTRANRCQLAPLPPGPLFIADPEVQCMACPG